MNKQNKKQSSKLNPNKNQTKTNHNNDNCTLFKNNQIEVSQPSHMTIQRDTDTLLRLFSIGRLNVLMHVSGSCGNVAELGRVYRLQRPPFPALTSPATTPASLLFKRPIS